MTTLTPELQKQIEDEALELTAKLRTNNDYSTGYSQGLENGYEKGATAYAGKAQRLADALQDLVESIPGQTEDADWWPDSLRAAIERANEHIQDWQNKEGL